MGPSSQTSTSKPSTTSDFRFISTKPVKRRATQACIQCRHRKVRCDYIFRRPSSCTNCRLDGNVCEVPKNNRRKSHLRDGFSHVTTANLLAPEAAATTQWHEDPLPPGGPEPELQDAAPERDSVNELMPEPEMGIEQNNESMMWKSLSVPLDPTSQKDQPCESEDAPNIVLPPYLRPVPNHIANEDLVYLEKKKAFEIPATIQRNELIRCYIQYVHPLSPIIDLRDFLRAIDQHEPSEPISLMLLQAVMFAGTTFIDMTYVTGYEDRHAYQKAYFQKVKTLYDLDYEEDRVTIVQCVLLMTNWYERPSYHKDIWHWVGIAVADARSIGLNYEPQAGAGTVQEKRLWKRIWWSCYTRDRLVSTGMRRTMRIREEECQLSMLDLADFEACTSLSDFEHMIGTACAVGEGATHANLVRLYIALIELCKIIADVLTLQYEEPSQKIKGTREATSKLIPKPRASALEVEMRDRDLEAWYAGLPVEIRYSFLETPEERKPVSDRLVYLHSTVVASVYLGISSALYRPQCWTPVTEHPTEMRKKAMVKVYDAACKVAQLYRDVVARNMIDSVPNTSVAVLLPACVVLHADASRITSPTRNRSRHLLEECIQVLQHLSRTFASARFALWLASQMMQKINLSTQISTSQPEHRPSDPNADQSTVHPAPPQDPPPATACHPLMGPPLSLPQEAPNLVPAEMIPDDAHLPVLEEQGEDIDQSDDFLLNGTFSLQEIENHMNRAWWDPMVNF
ncbi:hypothetical protein AYO21_02810 [Fonsecaea monophora]|uniref:Zn(2)-C6 fungal-type domain-containing protein n=1 Tax=Fonsecaea monophora TaxID=254056 RepID=A0A177FIA7_9EURO|nr:hypothetical protein AYO21_02810 [Fonsecaea monophora]OAG42859.1 hypothetical protein AYO21_02810 [Fonsecaea monophora]